MCFWILNKGSIIFLNLWFYDLYWILFNICFRSICKFYWSIYWVTSHFLSILCLINLGIFIFRRWILSLGETSVLIIFKIKHIGKSVISLLLHLLKTLIVIDVFIHFSLQRLHLRFEVLRRLLLGIPGWMITKINSLWLNVCKIILLRSTIKHQVFTCCKRFLSWRRNSSWWFTFKNYSSRFKFSVYILIGYSWVYFLR